MIWLEKRDAVLPEISIRQEQYGAQRKDSHMYLLHGKLTARPGQTEMLAGILMEASKLVAAVKGCRLYVIGRDAADTESVYVTEIWDSKEDHDNSLKAAGVKELIVKAMPLLDGPPSKGQELEILGGAGI